MATTAGIRAGRAFVELFTEQSALIKGLRQAEDRVKAFGKSVAEIGSKIAGLGAGIITPLLGAAKHFANAGSELNDMATRTGVSVEALSALGFAAKQSGADIGDVEIGIKKMQKSLVAGSEENIAAQSTFASLGLSIERLAMMRPEKQFEEVAKRIGAIRDPTARAGAALQVFGKSGTALLPMIQDFDMLTQQAKDFGLVWTKDEAEKADALGDSIDLLTASLGKSVAVVGSALAPALTDLAVWLAKAAKWASDFAKANGPLIITIAKVGAGIAIVGTALTALGIAIVGIGAVIGTIASGLAAVGAAIAFLVTPVGQVVVGLTALTVWLLKSTQTGQQMVGFLSDAFRGIAKTATDTFKGIGDALKAGDIVLAGRILWAGLTVEFTKGVNFIKGIWRDWSGVAIDAMSDVQTKISAGLIGLWSMIKSGWTQAVGTIADVLIAAVGAIKSAWSSLIGYFGGMWDNISALAAKSLIDIKKQAKIAAEYLTNPIGALGGNFSSDQYMKGLEEQADREKANIDKSVVERAAAREKNKVADQAVADQAILLNQQEAASKIAGIDKARDEQLKALFDAANAEQQAREKARQTGLEVDKDALKEAQDNLAKLLAKAKEKAGGGIAPQLPGKTRVPGTEEFTPEGLGDALQKAKIDVAGGFQASALGGLGAGKTTQDQQLAESKKQTAVLEKLDRKAKVGQLVFS